MGKRMTVAQVLRLAANTCLWNGYARDTGIRKAAMSCIAVDVAMDVAGPYVVPRDKTRQHLRRLGVNCTSTREFDEFPPGPKRQSARYAWLMFAADIAEEWKV